jgi:hypothetical protein
MKAKHRFVGEKKAHIFLGTKTNQIFFACNYSNKKVKGHFNSLKTKLENEYPVRVVLIDKQRHKGAQDLWVEIEDAIRESCLIIFDVTGYRPNVILELGYTLAITYWERIMIVVDARKPRGGSGDSKWLLSDIGHLNRKPYKTVGQLDDYIYDNLIKVPAIERFQALSKAANANTSIPDKYTSVALSVLKELRSSKTLRDTDIERIIAGTNVHFNRLKSLLTEHKLAKRAAGKGAWMLIEKE